MREVMIGCDIVIETDFFDEVLHHFGVDLQGFVVSLVIQDLEADLTELLVGVEMVLEVWIRDFGDVKLVHSLSKVHFNIMKNGQELLPSGFMPLSESINVSFAELNLIFSSPLKLLQRFQILPIVLLAFG